MKNEVDEFLSSVNGPKKEDAFVQDANDPFSTGERAPKNEGLEDDVKNEGAEDDTKPLPFHKDPKIQKFIQKEVEKLSKATKPVEASAPKEGPEGSDELTDTLIEIIGNDTPQKVAAVKKFRAQLGHLEERGAQRALRDIQAQSEAAKAQETEDMRYLSNAFDEIEEQNGVDFSTTQGNKMRNDFIDFIARISPKDEEGEIKDYPDMQEAWSLFISTRKPAENKRAKDLAARGMTRSSEATAAPARGQTWKDVDRILSNLQK